MDVKETELTSSFRLLFNSQTPSWKLNDLQSSRSMQRDAQRILLLAPRRTSRWPVRQCPFSVCDVEKRTDLYSTAAGGDVVGPAVDIPPTVKGVCAVVCIVPVPDVVPMATNWLEVAIAIVWAVELAGVVVKESSVVAGAAVVVGLPLVMAPVVWGFDVVGGEVVVGTGGFVVELVVPGTRLVVWLGGVDGESVVTTCVVGNSVTSTQVPGTETTKKARWKEYYRRTFMVCST